MKGRRGMPDRETQREERRGVRIEGQGEGTGCRLREKGKCN